jgi:hypothetical protein
MRIYTAIHVSDGDDIVQCRVQTKGHVGGSVFDVFEVLIVLHIHGV